MISDDEGTEPVSIWMIGIEEAVDHRQSVALLIREARANEAARPAVYGRLAIFDHKGPDWGLLNHVGEIKLIHVGHATTGMARSEIATEQRELLFGGPRL